MKLFITFEGGEGSGKSTQIQLLTDHLRRQGYTVVATREPGGTRIGDQIRRLLLDSDLSEMDSRTEALLYAASRAQLVREVIRPALSRENIVICDRYIDSSIAYQAFARGLERAMITDLSQWATDSLMPDLTFLLKIPPETGLSRATGGKSDRIEQEELSFHGRVALGFDELAAENPGRFRIIAADNDVELIHSQIIGLVDERLNA